MIRITQERLDQGLGLLNIAGNCPNSQNCLWSKRLDFLYAPCGLPKGCPRERCGIVIFRKTLEEDSPAFFAEALNLSQFNGIVKMGAAIETKAGWDQKNALEIFTERANDLHIFGQLFILALYPLFLETKQIPFLETKEVINLAKGYSGKEARQTSEKMRGINFEWFRLTREIMRYLVSNDGYPQRITYLVYLFLTGLEKDQLPDLMNMPSEEKEKFFSEIVKGIS